MHTVRCTVRCTAPTGIGSRSPDSDLRSFGELPGRNRHSRPKLLRNSVGSDTQRTPARPGHRGHVRPRKRRKRTTCPFVSPSAERTYGDCAEALRLFRMSGGLPPRSRKRPAVYDAGSDELQMDIVLAIHRPRPTRGGGGGEPIGGGGGGGASGVALASLVNPGRRRVTCHVCGNMRKNMEACTRCPMMWCLRCLEKVGGKHPATGSGCNYCLGECCCSSNKTTPNEPCTNARHCCKFPPIRNQI